MFSRVVLRRVDPAASRADDDIESQPLSPRIAEHPEMSERSQGFSRFRFSHSTQATSSAASDWPANSDSTSQATHPSRANANIHPALRPTSSHYPEDDDSSLFDHASHQSTMPSRYSVIVDLPSTRLHLPGLQRTWTQGSNGPPTSRPAEVSRPPPSPACRPHTPPTNPLGLTQPQPAHLSQPHATTRLGSHEADELYHATPRPAFTDPAEAALADMAEDGRRRRRGESGRGSGRRRRHHHHQHRDRSDETPEQREERRRRRRERRRRQRDEEDDGDDERRSERPHPKHFLFCFPWVKRRKTRSQILQCFVSGLFLVLMLSVYLVLSATENIADTEFSVLLILIVLFAAIFFFQGLIRLIVRYLRPQPTPDERRRNELAQAQRYGPGGYAVPRKPIRVVLARDEEAAGIESETTKIDPPAYGLWRESVRVDPNRIFWKRNSNPPPLPIAPDRSAYSPDHDSSSGEDEESEGGSSRTRRPPSYMSEDGVSYIIEAQPRSTAPMVQSSPEMSSGVMAPSPLPVHPAEMGRVATPPSR